MHCEVLSSRIQDRATLPTMATSVRITFADAQGLRWGLAVGATHRLLGHGLARSQGLRWGLAVGATHRLLSHGLARSQLKLGAADLSMRHGLGRNQLKPAAAAHRHIPRSQL